MKKNSKTRRDFIKNAAMVSSAAFVLPSFNIIQSPQLEEEIIGHGKFKYRIHRSWGNLNPSTTPVNNCHEMVMDSKGRLIMVTDEPKNNVLIYDKSGKLLDSWGLEYNSAHGLSISNEGGEDFLFITNPNDDNAKVVKTTVDGRVVMTLPDPRDIGEYVGDQNYLPTETAIAANGDIYVADGYASQYILQFNSAGEFIRKFGGKGDDEDNFRIAHGVTIDNRDPQNPTLICTSRSQNCFKRFSMDGEFISMINMPGAFVCRAVMDDENIYAGVCWSRLKYTDWTKESGFVTILDKNDKVVSNPGGTQPFYHKGELQLMKQDQPYFKHCHDVCIDEDKNLYVCQWNADKSYPIKLERV